MIGSLLITTLVGTSVVLALGLIVVAAMRRQSAALRHWVLTMAVVSALAVPWLTLVVPSSGVSQSVPFRLSTSSSPVAVVDVAFLGATSGAGQATPTAAGGRDANAGTASWRRSMEIWAIALWFAGAVLVAAVPVIGAIRLWIVRRGAVVVHDGAWGRHLARLAHTDDRLRRTVLVQCGHPSSLVTWGVRRPVIVLPRGAAGWTDARIEVVLRHEAAHIRRGDWVTQLAAECLCAVCWCTPLVWLTRARLQAEAERACDDAVLTAGVSPMDYANHLVDLARTLGRSRVGPPAPAMARPSSLEGRVTDMLNPSLVRTPPSRRTRWSVAFLGVGLAASLASLAAQSTFATVTGTVRDPLGGTVPSVVVTMTDATSGAKHEVRANDRGAFEFVGLVPGNYALDARAAGFQTVSDTIQLAAGQTLRRDLSLPVGTLEESINVYQTPGLPSPRTAPRQVSRPATCSAGPNSGHLTPPRKVVDVRPRYPASMAGSSVEGRVVMHAMIGTDGAIREVHTIEATNADFQVAAEDAVRQWRFTETLLNCVPIDVEMRVTTAFKSDAMGPPPPPPPPPLPPRPPQASVAPPPPPPPPPPTRTGAGR